MDGSGEQHLLHGGLLQRYGTLGAGGGGAGGGGASCFGQSHMLASNNTSFPPLPDASCAPPPYPLHHLLPTLHQDHQQQPLQSLIYGSLPPPSLPLCPTLSHPDSIEAAFRPSLPTMSIIDLPRRNNSHPMLPQNPTTSLLPHGRIKPHGALARQTTMTRLQRNEAAKKPDNKIPVIAAQEGEIEQKQEKHYKSNQKTTKRLSKKKRLYLQNGNHPEIINVVQKKKTAYKCTVCNVFLATQTIMGIHVYSYKHRRKTKRKEKNERRAARKARKAVEIAK